MAHSASTWSGRLLPHKFGGYFPVRYQIGQPGEFGPNEQLPICLLSLETL